MLRTSSSCPTLQESREVSRVQDSARMRGSDREPSEGDNLSRQKWIQHMKNRRQESISLHTERNLIKKALYDTPEMFGKNAMLRFQHDWLDMMPQEVGREVDRSSPPSRGVNSRARLSLPSSPDAVTQEKETRYDSEGVVSTEEDTRKESEENNAMSGRMEALRRLSLRSLLATAETPTPIAHNFLQHTVGIEELRNHLNGPHMAKHVHKTIGGPGNLHDFGHINMVGADVDDNSSVSDDGESTLVNSIFLVGPNEEEVTQFVDKVLDEYLDNNKSRSASDETVNYGLNISGDSDSRPRSMRSITIDSVPSPTIQAEGMEKPPAQTLKKTNPSVTADMIYITSENPLVETEVLPSFCFPRGIETTVAVLPNKIPLMSPMKRKPSPRYASRQRILFQSKTSTGTSNCNRFVFLLSNHTSHHYGICMTVPRIVTFEKKNKSIKVKTFYCVTILTVYPFFAFFFQLLTEYVNMKGFCVDASSFIKKQSSGDLLQYELRHLESFAMKLIRHAIPHPGQSLVFSYTMNMIRRELTIKRLLINDRVEENCVGTLLWALPIVLKNFELDLLLEVLGCLLVEMKVVIRCKNLEVLSACILTFIYLLRPLSWVCPTIVILPSSMHEILDSPVPVLVGVESTPPSFVMTSGLIVVDPEQKVIHWHPSDLVTKKALTLPKVSKLQQQLKPTMDNIMKLTKKLKKKKLLALSANEVNLSSTTHVSDISEKGNVSIVKPDPEENANDRPVSMPTRHAPNMQADPAIGEDDYVQSPLLASAIATFSNTVSHHMKKVTDTAIQMRWKMHQVKLQQKLDLANAPREPQNTTSRHISSDESINSDASTIFSNDNSGSNTAAGGTSPIPPPPGAVWFTQQELGSGGFTFMQSFIQSQMFCNYIQLQHEQEVRLAKTRRDEEENELKEGSDSVTDVSVIDDDGNMNHIDGDLAAEKRKNNPESQQLHSKSNSHNASPRLNDDIFPLLPDDSDDYANLINNRIDSPRKDPLASIFGIMLTGSHPLSQSKVDELLQTYEKLYTKPHKVHDEPNAQFETKSSDDIHQMSGNFDCYPLYIEDISDIEASLHCNGRCGGLANTPSCTNICLELWEQKAQNLRRQASVVDIIRRRGSSLQYHSASQAKGKSEAVDIYRNLLPKRHKRETIGQYTHRASLITGRNEKDILDELNFESGESLTVNKSTMSRSSGHNKIETTSNHPQLSESSSSSSLLTAQPHLMPRNLHLKGLSTDSLSSTGLGISMLKQRRVSPAVAAITKRLKKRQHLKLQSLRQSEVKNAATLIQKEFRAYIVRNNIAVIITSLLVRKKRSMSLGGGADVKENDNTTIDEVTNIPDEEKEKENEEDMLFRESDDTENILHQSDHQYFADDLMGAESVQMRDSIESRKSMARSSTYSDTSNVSGGLKSQRHSHSDGFLLNGLLPLGPRKDKISLSLSPSSVFSRGRSQSRSGAVDHKRGSPLGMDDSVAVRRSHSDSGLLDCKESSSTDLSTDVDNRKPLTSEQRKESFTRMLSNLSIDAILQGSMDEGDEVENMTNNFDVLSPRVVSPPIITNISEEETSESLIFDESLLNEDGVPYPVHYLGPRAGDILSYPQQKKVIALWQLLRNGIVVLKHGRSGRPKHRTLYCDDNLQILYWRDGDTEHHHEVDRSKTTRRSSFNVFSRKDAVREVVLRDVLEVRGDLTTDVMKRSVAKGYVEEQPSLVISLILKDRTLDLQIDEEHWGPMYDALQIIVEFHQRQVHLLDM